MLNREITNKIWAILYRENHVFPGILSTTLVLNLMPHRNISLRQPLPPHFQIPNRTLHQMLYQVQRQVLYLLGRLWLYFPHRYFGSITSFPLTRSCRNQQRKIDNDILLFIVGWIEQPSVKFDVVLKLIDFENSLTGKLVSRNNTERDAYPLHVTRLRLT